MGDGNPFYKFVSMCLFYATLWLVNWIIMAGITRRQVKKRGGIGITMWEAMQAPGVWLYSAVLTAVPIVMHKLLKNTMLSYEQRIAQNRERMKTLTEENLKLQSRYNGTDRIGVDMVHLL
eukprot:jgi/Mesvir1/19831/Mv13121-RA.1